MSRTAIAVLALGLAAGAAHADVAVFAQANGSTNPPLVPATQQEQNGDFTILANPSSNFTGDGWDETTIWNFDLAADPAYAAFSQGATLIAADLTLTLTTQYPNGPITDVVHPDGPFITIVMPQFLQDPGTGSISFNLMNYWNPTDFLSFITAHNGVLPMVYGDDAIVSHAEIHLTSSAVPTPGSAALLAAAILGVARRRRP